MAPDYNAERDLLARAADMAGRIALGYFRSDLGIEEKPDGQGPVTDADRAVDTALREALMRERPGYGWLSEETEDSADRLSARHIFVVDPIDGTRAFIAGEPGWAISAALVENGVPVAAAIHLPARGRTYSAALGAGARCNGAALSVSAAAALEQAETLAARPQLAEELWPGGVPPVKRTFRSSLAWRLSLVAEGRFDAMLTLRDSWEWDVAAGCLIATEAGARVTDRDGRALAFNNPRPLVPGVIAAPPGLHREFIARRAGRPAD